MRHSFYQKSIASQNRWLVGVAIIALGILLAFLGIMLWSKQWWIALFLYPLFSLLTPFFDVPSGIRQGTLVYGSPLFIIQPLPKKKELILHGGTLFDYFFVLKPLRWKRNQTKHVLIGYLQGLLALIDDETYEDDWVVQGTSYWLNQRTAERFGFQAIEIDPFQKLIITLNFFQLSLALSYAKGEPSIAKVSNTLTFESKLGSLRKKKTSLCQYLKRLEE